MDADLDAKAAAGPAPLPRNVKLLGWASLLNDVASEMAFPLLPQFFLGELGGTKFQLGLMEGLADSTSSLLKLGSGAWSDRLRLRKGLVVWGYAVAAVARPLIALLLAAWQLTVLRVADRIGKGIRTSPRDALIADCTEPQVRGRAFGFQRAMDHLGAALGPLVAMAILALWAGRLRELFLVTLLPGALATCLLLFHLREKAPGPATPARTADPARPFGRGFKLYLASLVVFTLGNSSDAFLLVRAGELGVPELMLPLLWCGFHVAKSTGNLVAGRLVDRVGPRPMILLGWLVYAAIYLAFAVAVAAWQVWALFVGYAVYYALTEPAEKTMVANLVAEEQRGLAYGWFHFAVGITTLPASAVFGWIYGALGALAAFGWGAGLAGLAAVILLAVRKP